MTNQEKKQYLLQYRRLNAEIERLMEEKERWYARASRITPTYSDLPRGGVKSDNVQSAVEKICDIENRIVKKIDALVDMKTAIEAAIQTVEDDTLQRLLALHYLAGLTWEEVAVRMHYSWRQTIRLHGKALNALELG